MQPRSALVPDKKEAISSRQPRSALKSDARQSATSVVAATAGSMTSSLSDGTYQKPERSKSASPVHHGDVAGSMEYAASVAVLKEMVQHVSSSSIAVLKEVEQQLSSLAQVVWNLHGHIHG